MRDSYQAILALTGAIIWSSLLLLKMGFFTLEISPYGIILRHFISPDILPWVFFAMSSWIGAWMSIFSSKVLSPYCLEAEDACLIGALQAILPFLAPLLLLIYLFISRR